MNHVYISHAREDSDTSHIIKRALEEKDIVCHLTPHVTSSSESQEPSVELTSSSLLILVYSSHANNSRAVKHEAQFAIEQDLTLIPFRLEDAPLSEAMEYFISTVHWLDAMVSPIDPAVERLVSAVQHALPSASLSSATLPLMANRVMLQSVSPLSSETSSLSKVSNRSEGSEVSGSSQYTPIHPDDEPKRWPFPFNFWQRGR